MHVTSCRIAAMLLFGSLGSLAGCASVDEPALGAIRLDLVGQAASGTVYRLRNAIITVQGPTSSTIWNTEDAPDQTSLSANVVVGDYTAAVQAGWRLERLDGAMATTVTAQLASDNPVQFTVAALQRTSVPLQFRVNAEVVDMSQGYDIVVDVQESPPLLAVANNVLTGFGAGGVGVFVAGASGNAAPVREIKPVEFFPSAVVVADDQLIVSDELFGTINFYPATATGDVAPSRQIGGPASGLFNPTAMAVFDGELYVVQLQSTILVFPLTGTSFVPSRTLSVPGAQSLVIDHGELYVVSAGSTILVYPTTAVGFAEPARAMFLPTGCANGIVARGGEIFVTDTCGGGVHVFPEAAAGPVAPLRTISGPRTGLVNTTAIALFGGELYVSDVATSSVRVFPVAAEGDVFPTRVITGGRTDLASPAGVFVF
jgi:hypothetical protein